MYLTKIKPSSIKKNNFFEVHLLQFHVSSYFIFSKHANLNRDVSLSIYFFRRKKPCTVAALDNLELLRINVISKKQKQSAIKIFDANLADYRRNASDY